MEGWAQDVRFGLRSLARRPSFAGVAILTLALGIGANVAIFSVVHGVLLRPLPYPDPNRIVVMWENDTRDGSRGRGVDHPDVRAWQAAVPEITIAGYNGNRPTLTGLGDPEVIYTAQVTDGLLAVFGLEPEIGRDLTAVDDVPGGPRVIVVSHAFWRSRLGGDPNVLGRTVTLSGEPWEVVGVAPEGFDFPNGAVLWQPQRHQEEGCGHGCRFMNAVGRIEAGASPQRLQERLDAVSAALASDFPDAHRDSRTTFEPLLDTQVAGVKTALWVLLGAVVMVLLIACANVANLLLVRASERVGEVALRQALGAPRVRLVRQLLTESFLLSLAGGALGLAVAQRGVTMLLRLAPPSMPRLDAVRMDGVVLVFALAVVLAVTLVFGLVPAFRLAGQPLTDLLGSGRRTSGGRRVGFSRSLLLSGEVALSLMLLLGAGLLLGTLSQIRAADMGFDTEQIERFRISLPESRYDVHARLAFLDELEQRLTALHEVDVAGSAFGAPLGNGNISSSVQLLDRDPVDPADRPEVVVRPASPGYLGAMGIPLVRGRWIEAADRRDSAPVAVINQAAADRFYPGADPVGRQIALDMNWGFDDEPPRTIVGVVGDTRSQEVTEPDEPTAYVANAQFGAENVYVTLRLARGAPTALPAARGILASMDAQLAVTDARRMEDVVADELTATRFYFTLLGVFSGLALALAAVGLYGVVSYAVSRRTREIGIRVALGARRDQVLGMVVREGMAPAAGGVLLGIAGSLAGGRVMGALLYGVEPNDLRTISLVTATMLVVTLGATLVPARRAARIPPSTALREE